MSPRGLGYLEKEGIIQNIDVLDDSKIRIVVKASMEGYGFSNDHAMLNIEDEEYVSLSRYHSIISTFQDLSKHLGEEITEDNKGIRFKVNRVAAATHFFSIVIRD